MVDLILLCFCSCLPLPIQSFVEPQDSETNVQLVVLDETGKPVACRVHLKNKSGTPVNPKGVPFWNDHFVCDGTISLSLPAGTYDWLVERGPEYQRKSGNWVVGEESRLKSKEITLNRIANLRAEGWVSADLHVHRSPKDIQLLMQAEDLDYAPVITWWNAPQRRRITLDQTRFEFDSHRMFELNAGEDEREGGALLYFGLKSPLDLTVKSREYPSPMTFVHQARRQNRQVWIDIEKPFWWDVPTWLSTGEMNSIGLANNHMLHGGMLESEAWGKSRDKKRFPDPLGNGYWSQYVYYQILNSGIRIPPSAGSASGVLKNPVGYNRVYARQVGTGDESQPKVNGFSRDKFYSGLEQGRSFVTNGPLLRVTANGKPPGTEFEFEKAKGATIGLEIELDSNDHVRALEVIRNGKIAKTIFLENYNADHKKRGPQHESVKSELTLDAPGWFLVRAISDRPETFRFASTAPFYVGQIPVRRDSVEFFQSWVNERINRVKANVRDPDQRRTILAWHEKAKSFWETKLAASLKAPNESLAESRARTLAAIAHSIESFDGDLSIPILNDVARRSGRVDLVEGLEDLILAEISINPESRVKIASARDKIKLTAGQWHRFLVRVENVAGITAPLRLRAIDLSKPKPAFADGCQVKFVDNPYTSSTLTGHTVELKLLQIKVTERGLNEVRFVADAGQGTQDLGFRATVDWLIDSR